MAIFRRRKQVDPAGNIPADQVEPLQRYDPEKVQEARRLNREGKYVKAVKVYEQAGIEHSPDPAFRTHELLTAGKAALRAAGKKPSIKERFYKSAESFYTKALNTDNPVDVGRAVNGLAVVEYERGNFDKAHMLHTGMAIERRDIMGEGTDIIDYRAVGSGVGPAIAIEEVLETREKIFKKLGYPRVSSEYPLIKMTAGMTSRQLEREGKTDKIEDARRLEGFSIIPMVEELEKDPVLFDAFTEACGNNIRVPNLLAQEVIGQMPPKSNASDYESSVKTAARLLQISKSVTNTRNDDPLAEDVAAHRRRLEKAFQRQTGADKIYKNT